MAINILLWYNKNNHHSEDFAQGFKVDMSKGMMRFHLNFQLRVNEPRAEGDCCLLVVSSNDFADSTFMDQCRTALATTGTFLLCIDPFEMAGLQANVSSQPFLFWDKRYETGEIRLYRRDSNETKSNYWEKITDIAVSVQSIFGNQELKKKSLYAYLSQDDISHSSDRDNLMRDLNDLGFSILPERPLSTDFETCTNEVQAALAKSKLVVHIIPPIYNIHFPDHHLSLTEHQCNISAKYMALNNSDSIRMIWISSSYEVSDEENQVFIEKIQRDQDQTRNTTVLKTSIEDLKRHYRHLLGIKAKDSVEPSKPTDVYLILDGSSNGVESTLKGAFGKGQMAVDSNFSGITYSQHLNKLSQAGIVVISYQSDNPNWLSVKVNDILKSNGVDSARPIERVVLLKGSESLDVESLNQFFTDVFTDINQVTALVQKLK